MVGCNLANVRVFRIAIRDHLLPLCTQRDNGRIEDMKTLGGRAVRGLKFCGTPTVRRRYFVSWVGIAILFAVATAFSVAPGNQAQADDDYGTGAPPGEQIHEVDEGIEYGLEVGSGNDELVNSRDTCAGPAEPKWAKGDPIIRYEQIKKTAKDGTVTYTNGKPLRTERMVTITCNGNPIRQFWQCTSCPPPPPPDIHKLVRRQIQLTGLRQPTPSLWPKPIDSAPLPGVGFYYGIYKAQFDTIQPDWLTVCALYNCVSVFVKSKPIRVYFTPGDGTPRLTSCNWEGPVVRSKKEANVANDPIAGAPLRRCRYVYKKAGKYTARLQILYEISWTFYNWTFTDAPPRGSGVMYGTTGRPFPLTVHERQPVVIG
jgi:hypothetical protein